MTCAAFAAADLEGKTDEGKSGRRTDLESVISFNKALEQLGEAQVVLDVVLQSLLSVGPQHKPDLQGSEPSTQRDLPVLCHIPTQLYFNGHQNSPSGCNRGHKCVYKGS